ncbi:DUF2637 domain-containing protein [Streptomyces sp. A30]|uniref:DUF2637 domain-containing protein n=1 Tax=Streptomyces sp. A30 TaxID=2789273 RepID=UPI00397ED169
MTEPLGADTAGERPALPAQTGPDREPAPVGGAEGASAVAGDSAQGAPSVPRRRLVRIMWVVAFVAVIAGLTVAAVGFALSYNTLVDAARGWGFGPKGSYAVPIGIDGLIIALYSIDLVLVWRKMPKPSLLLAAHATTAVTILLNVTGAAEDAPGSLGVWEVAQTDPGRLLSHAVMPVAYVLLTEAARHLITRTARLEEGRGTLTLANWLLDLRGTWKVWRRSKLWEFDYDTVRRLERERKIYGVWIQYREEIEAARAQHREQGGSDEDFDENGLVTVLDRLPDLLAPYGVTVSEALALPDQMRRDEQERRHQAEAAARELRHAKTLARLAGEKEELKEQGELDKLRAQVEGDRKAAEHYAAATADTAGIEAAAQRSKAERLATEEQRRAEAEAQAEESARTAALKRKAAEDTKAAQLTEAQNLSRRQELADAAQRAATTEADAQAKARQAAEDKEAAAVADRRAIEYRTAVARAELVAVAAEDAARLNDRERNIRRVARLAFVEAGGDAMKLPTARIEQFMGVANSTATGYREEADKLIRGGYDFRVDPIHAADQEIHR